MEVRELRIGNLVEYRITDELDERKEWWEVSEIDADDINWLSKVDLNDEDFRPIPLTEEWLLKFGFEKQKDGCYLKKKIAFIPEVKNGNFLIRNSEEKEEWFRIFLKIQYVHQIQNLYFALTGEELTIC